MGGAEDVGRSVGRTARTLKEAADQGQWMDKVRALALSWKYEYVMPIACISPGEWMSESCSIVVDECPCARFMTDAAGINGCTKRTPQYVDV